jgi:hypothetical protein
VTTVVVSATPLVHAAWRDALPGATVFGPSVDPALLVGADVVILDLPASGQVRAVLRGAVAGRHARCVWVHADIEPDDIVAARGWGVTHTVHRSSGLAPVLAAIDEELHHPRATLIGRIRDRSSVESLSVEEVLLLQRLGSGSTVAQLRTATGWSRHEVERLRVSALGKLGVHTTGEALAIVLLAEQIPR